jgi:hypothetical protein
MTWAFLASKALLPSKGKRGILTCSTTYQTTVLVVWQRNLKQIIKLIAESSAAVISNIGSQLIASHF